MFGFLILACVAIFCLGLWTTFRLLVRAITGETESKNIPPTSRSAGPSPSRVQLLALLENEVLRASEKGRLSPKTERELLEYFRAERERLGASVSAKPRSEERLAAPDAVPPSEAGAPRPAEASAGTPVEPSHALRDPERIRAAIAKLHADAQAPVVSESAAQAAAPASVRDEALGPPPRPGQVPLPAAHEQTVEERAPAGAGVAHETSATPATTESLPISAAPERTTEAPVPRAAPPAAQPLAERLFTPENVRILQSLGIGIIFISAAAFIRTKLWAGASAWTQLGILLAGTLACSGLGYALCRWTALRITGLGFLLLGHLSLALDAFATLIPSGSAQPLYPYAPSSLWTLVFLAFAASSAAHARALQEPLFAAFTFFGGLAAWGAAAAWCGIPWSLWPAAFVPAALACGGLAVALERRGGKDLAPTPAPAGPPPSEPGMAPVIPEPAVPTVPVVQAVLAVLAGPAVWRRWSLPWWLDCAAGTGAWLLAPAMLAAALAAGRADLALHLAAHLAGLALLAVGLALGSARRERARTSHLAALLLLATGPLFAYAQRWHAAEIGAALAWPGVLLALAALALPRIRGLAGSSGKILHDAFFGWSAAAVVAGFACATLGFLSGSVDAAQWAWSSGVACAVGLAFAGAESAPWAPWLAAAGAGALLTALRTLVPFPLHALPALGLGLALGLQFLWRTPFARIPDVAQQGRQAADGLGVVAAAVLCVLAPPWVSTPGNPWLDAMGWAAAAVYALTTSVWAGSVVRRGLGVALLAPALSAAIQGAGGTWESPAPWLALLAFAVVVIAHRVESLEGSTERLFGACAGAAAIIGFGAWQAGWQSGLGEHAAASASFLLLAVAAAAPAALLRARQVPELPVLAEGAVLALLVTAAGSCAAAHDLWAQGWPRLFAPLAAGVLLAALVCETAECALLPALLPGAAPYRAAGEVLALGLAAAGIFGLLAARPALVLWPAELRLTLAWVSALVPLLIALRPRLPRAVTTKILWQLRIPQNGEGFPLASTEKHSAQKDDSPAWAAPLGFAMAFIAAGLALALALDAGFWRPACPAVQRAACSVYFLALLAVSLGAGIVLKCAFAPATGFIAALGLTGCAFGAWNLPPEAFGLSCVLLALGGWRLSRVLRATEWTGDVNGANASLDVGARDGKARSSLNAALEYSGAGAALLGAVHMFHGLDVWPAGGAQGYAAAAWLLLAMGLWRASRRPAFGVFAACAAGLAVLFSVCHVLRATGLPGERFGPALAGCALLLLCLREVFARPDPEAETGENPPGRRAKGLLIASVLSSLAALTFGFAGLWLGCKWEWSATLGECALFLATLAVLARRERENPRVHLLLALELGAWLLLALSLHAASQADEWNLDGTAWVLASGLFLLLGMAAESVAGALLGTARCAPAPSPFLESRHLAALGLGAFGLVCALWEPHAFQLPALDSTWRAFLGLAALALGASLTRWSSHEGWNRRARTACAVAAYLVLLPAGYLCLLKSHATGSSWGALWILAVVPLLLGAAWIQEREGFAAQASLARLGAEWMSLIALYFAFAGNRARLAEVPALTLVLLALEAWLLRAWKGRRECTALAVLALAGGFYFGLRAAAGLPAWGLAEPWAWELPALAGFGLAVLFVGAHFQLEPDGAGRSLVAACGAWLTAGACAACVGVLLLYGPAARDAEPGNRDRLDALIAATLLCSGTCALAQRRLGFAAGGVLWRVLVLGGYFLGVWRFELEAWEWYTLPASGFLFVWAWQLARAEKPAAREDSPTTGAESDLVGTLLLLASALAVVPSFLLALPYSEEALWHFLLVTVAGLSLVGGAMLARRKIPLLAGSGAVLLGLLIKTGQWAVHHNAFLPGVGIGVGLAILAAGCLLEARMNRALRQAVDRAKAEAHMFWVSWR